MSNPLIEAWPVATVAIVEALDNGLVVRWKQAVKSEKPCGHLAAVGIATRVMGPTPGDEWKGEARPVMTMPDAYQVVTRSVAIMDGPAPEAHRALLLALETARAARRELDRLRLENAHIHDEGDA